MLRLALGLVAVCMASGVVASDISVVILDTPELVYSFEPIFVTFEVRNKGDEPLIIPLDQVPGEGAFLEYSSADSSPRHQEIAYDSRNRRLAWIAPGGRRLFFQTLIPQREGELSIRAVAEGPGRCQGRPIGSGSENIVPVEPLSGYAGNIECLDGRTESSFVSVRVEIPTSPEDREALALLGDKIQKARGLLAHLSTLRERFPNSHYTYAAHQAIGGGGTLLDAVLLQPNNPLNSRAVGGIARSWISQNCSCAEGRVQLPDPQAIRERYERVIAAYPPPTPVREYLDQFREDVELECLTRAARKSHLEREDDR